MWTSQVAKHLTSLEQVSWAGDTASIAADIEDLEAHRFWLLPPQAQSRRQGLLGDWHHDNGRASTAMVNYALEFGLTYWKDYLSLETIKIFEDSDSILPVSVNLLIAADIEIPKGEPIDSSHLTSKLKNVPSAENAYYALNNLPLLPPLQSTEKITLQAVIDRSDADSISSTKYCLTTTNC